MTESNSSPESMLAAFDRHCPLLFSIAYRILGSVADAEGVVQEAYLRWQRASDIRSPKAYLATVVTRLCLDHLRKARMRRADVPENRYGRIRWEEFLRKETVGKPGTSPLIGRRKHDRPGVCPGSPGRKGEGVTARGLVWMGVPTDDFGGTVAFFRDVMGLETFYGGESVAVHRRHERGARSHQDSWYMLAGDSEEGRIPRMEVHE